MMTFGSAVSTCLQRKYVDFSGRASRSEFWWFALFQIVVLVVASMIHEAVYGIAALALLLPALAVGARRLQRLVAAAVFRAVRGFPGAALLERAAEPAAGQCLRRAAAGSGAAAVVPAVRQ